MKEAFASKSRSWLSSELEHVVGQEEHEDIDDPHDRNEEQDDVDDERDRVARVQSGDDAVDPPYDVDGGDAEDQLDEQGKIVEAFQKFFHVGSP